MTYSARFKDLIERDGIKCYYCGEENVTLEIHHRLPLSKGGTTNIENCVLVCSQCNIRIGDRLNEFEFNFGATIKKEDRFGVTSVLTESLFDPRSLKIGAFVSWE